MKLRKNILKLSVLAGIVCCLLVAGTFLAAGSAAPAAVDESKLNLMLTVSDVDNGAFTVTVKVANEDITDFKMAGLQVFLTYDSSLGAPTAASKVSTDHSTAVINVVETERVVKFVCVKNEFTDDLGYTNELGELFTATFQAGSVTKPSALFSEANVTFLMGSTTYEALTTGKMIYGANNVALAEAILNSELTLGGSDTIGTVVFAPANALKVANVQEAISGATITGATGYSGVIGTGAVIKLEGEENGTPIVVKGDVDGDGLVTVFDAQIILNGNFVEKDLAKFAGDKDGNGNVDVNDVLAWLQTIVGKN